MLEALKHRGPDSTGFALYGEPQGNELIMRFKLAEQEETRKGFDIHKRLPERRQEVDRRIDRARRQGHRRVRGDRVRLPLSPQLRRRQAQAVGLHRGRRGRGDPVARLRSGADQGPRHRAGSGGAVPSDGFKGTHAIGHTRMATESDVDISSAHPFWAYPFADVSVVHNGQLTNYWTGRRALERRGHRFMSNCDSELIAVYLADRVTAGRLPRGRHARFARRARWRLHLRRRHGRQPRAWPRT